jgi:methyl-accepting chemotaxis protein
MSIRTKITLMGVLLPIISVVIVLSLIMIQRQNLSTKLRKTLDSQVNEELALLARDVYLLCRTENDAVLNTLQADLGVSRDILQRAGTVSLSRQAVSWDAKNQVTGETAPVTLPRLLVGETWLGQATDANTHVPIVDDTVRLTGAACTLFQRMNEKGDMLRIATSVLGKDGSRAIGTFIPSVNVDGSPNAVIATVLSGKTFQGRAFVVDSWYITAYEPILDEKGSVIGMLFVGVKQQNLKTLISSIGAIKIGKSGYAYVLQGTGVGRGSYIVSKDGKRDGENIWEKKDTTGRFFIQEMIKEALSRQNGDASIVTYPWKNPEDPAPRSKVVAVTYYAPWDWVIGVGAYQDETAAAAKDALNALSQLVWITLIAGLFVTLFASILAVVLGRSMARPISSMVDAAQQMAEGDLSHTVTANSRDEMGRLGNAFNHMTTRLNAMIRQVLDSSGQVAASSRQLSASSKSLAEGAQTQASTLEETAASMEELTTSVDQVSAHAQSQAAAVAEGSRIMEAVQKAIEDVTQNMAEISRLADGSVEDAQKGAQAVNEVTKGIKLIAESSEKIGGIVTVISDIAEQTNLLALNAAIEAARAGEHGRGFAVVADEVSKLADRSSSSTREIEALIRESVENVGRGVQMAAGSQGAMEQIRSASQKVKIMIADLTGSMSRQVGAIKELANALGTVSEMSQSISAATAEQSTNAKQVAKAVESVNELTQAAASSAEQMSSSTIQLSDMAVELQKMTAQFKIETNGGGSSAVVVRAESASKEASAP